MPTMPGYRALATYTKYQDRWYHTADTQHQGPSVSLHAFAKGARPAALVTTEAPRPARPVVECYPQPDVGRLVTQVQQGLALPPVTPSRPTVHVLACPQCHRLPCTCGVPKPGGLDAIVAMQRAQGKR